MSGPAVVDDFDFSIASIPPSLRQQRIAYGIIAVLFVGLAIVAWRGPAQLSRFDSFVPTVEGIIFVTDVATSTLLFSLFFSIGTRELLILADGYLFSGLIVIPHILSYPGAFAPNGLFVSDLQATPWLYTFWHFGFSAAVLGYACLKKEKQNITPFNSNTMSVIFWNVVGVFLLVCALTWTAIASERLLLPLLIADQIHFAPMANYVTAITLVTSIVAFVILWLQRRSTLDLWLLVAIFATVAEQAIVSLAIASRFSFGFYSSRMFSVAVSTVVLIALLSETISIYANLARLTRNLQRERDNKLMNAQTITAAIAHEVRQPLAAIAIRGLDRADKTAWSVKVPRCGRGRPGGHRRQASDRGYSPGAPNGLTLLGDVHCASAEPVPFVCKGVETYQKGGQVLSTTEGTVSLTIEMGTARDGAARSVNMERGQSSRGTAIRCSSWGWVMRTGVEPSTA